MRCLVNRTLLGLATVVASAASLTSCDMMTDDLSNCPYGIYVNFKYDYNLQRADMFNDHVGAVTLYVFDAGGKLVKTQEESNIGASQPLKDRNYVMHVTDLEPGRYRFLALAGQKPYADMLLTDRAKFVRTDMAAGSGMQDLEINLDKSPAGDGRYNVVNNGLPLDTLWHGMQLEGTEYSPLEPAYTTVSLVRDTKKIHVTLREIDDPSLMDIADYDMTITDRNSHLLWDNAPDETDAVVYTPHATWNTADRTVTAGTSLKAAGQEGRIGHADFMTSRILIHDRAADDGVLSVVSKKSGEEIIRVNLPDMLSRLRSYEDIYRYTDQEFLDRGYDYNLDFYLKGDRLQYVSISVSVLGWSVRVQFEDL